MYAKNFWSNYDLLREKILLYKLIVHFCSKNVMVKIAMYTVAIYTCHGCGKHFMVAATMVDFDVSLSFWIPKFRRWHISHSVTQLCENQLNHSYILLLCTVFDKSDSEDGCTFDEEVNRSCQKSSSSYLYSISVVVDVGG